MLATDKTDRQTDGRRRLKPPLTMMGVGLIQ